MKYDITSILEVAITVISAILTGFLIPFVRSRLSAEKKERLEFWIQTAVKAAEQLFKGSEKTGAQKRTGSFSSFFQRDLFLTLTR